MQAADATLTILRERLGSGASIRTDAESRLRASVDALRLSFKPDAVVAPGDESDVGVLLELANATGTPVTVRGAGSATTGATAPVRGGWVLDLSGWQAVRVDEQRGLAQVQPGAVVADIQAAADAVDWFYPPDPSSHRHATIGGTIATNAGGLRAAKYGVTRDYVVALEGFLPTGEFVRWGAPLRKFVSGFNVRDLWIGSEGMLGVVTAATLRLVRRPRFHRTALARFRDEEIALSAAAAVMADTEVEPAVLEFLDGQTVACALRRLRETPERAAIARFLAPAEGHREPAVLLVEVDGRAQGAVDTELERIRKILGETADEVRLAGDAVEAESLWSVRRTCSQAMFAMGNSKLNEDVVVPPASYQALLRFTRELREEIQLATPTFGHAADGNFHVHIMYDRENGDHRERAERGIRRIMERVVELGGAITGEHGIGLAKSPFLRLQHSNAEIAAMRAIKDALDPRGILNPGKVFDEFPVWNHAAIDIAFPWDHR